MTDLLQDERAVLDQLQRALKTPFLPTRAETRCKALLDRLRASVRIGVFGLPGTGKRHLLNALAQETIIDMGLELPTMEFVHGPDRRTQIVLGDGSSLSAIGYPTQEIAEMEPAYLQVQTPAAPLSNCDALLVDSDPSPHDMAAALNWAATRVDLSIWCTQYWTCLLYTSPSPRDLSTSRMPSSA